MKYRIIVAFLLLLILKQLVWIAVVPLWHTPDEQAHFAQVAYMAEIGSSVRNAGMDLTREIYLSESLLGTVRDKSGNNRFTFHPDYKIPYSGNFSGLYETKIDNLKSNPLNRVMVAKEASRYPDFYYFLLSVVYKIFYGSGLFVRIFAARIFQTIFYLGTVLLSYLMAKMLTNNRLLSVSAAILVAFHPMFSFVSAGINSDNIASFIFSLFIFISLKILRGKLSLKKILLMCLVTYFSLYVKPQFYITVPLIFIILLYKLLVSGLNIRNKILLFFPMILLGLVGFWRVTASASGAGLLINNFISVFSVEKLIVQFKDYALPHFYREVMPWYWGIYDWLGVTYPRFVHRIINWITLISLAGLLIRSVRNFKKLNVWPDNAHLYLILINVLFFLGVYSFDFVQFAASGYRFHLGVQGRYFFPLIFSQLYLILTGWDELFSLLFKKTETFVKALGVLMIVLHFYALYFVAAIYYDMSSFSRFLIQASQYKPFFFKGIALAAVIIMAVTANVVFLLKYVNYARNHEKHKKA